MITRWFIERVRCYLDELGIEAKNGISYEDFEHESIKTINRCKEFSDLKGAIFCFKYCASKWNKIEKMFTKCLDKWQKYKYEGHSNVNVVEDEEESNSVVCLTNALGNKKEVFLTSKLFDDKMFSFKYQNGRYMIEDDSDYYMKYAKTSSTVMKLFDKKDNYICNIVLSKEFEIFLENNATEYELVIKREDVDDSNPFVAVFEKSYIKSLKDDELIDFENMIASIDWDLLDAKSDEGVARIQFFKPVSDITLILYFAASTFLLYKSYKDYTKSSRLGMLACLNLMWRRR